MNPYKTLQVDPEADVEVIQAAYKRLARRYHPDSAEQPDAAAFQRVVEAWELLGDPARRAAWDADHPRSTPASRGPSPPAGGAGPAVPPPQRAPEAGFDLGDLPPPRRRVRFGGPFLLLGPGALLIFFLGAVWVMNLPPAAPPPRAQAAATAADLAACRAEQARAGARAQAEPRSEAVDAFNAVALRCAKLEAQLGPTTPAAKSRRRPAAP